jgi:glycosyltransferase involved in cell wall biosynthesis
MPWGTVGGVEHATLRIAQATESARLHHVIICPEQQPIVREFFATEGFETTEYIVTEPSYRHPKFYLRASLSLARDLRRRRIDLVHCADLLAAHRMAFAARLAGVPVLCHVRTRYPSISRRDQSFLWWVNKFVFVSRNTWEQFDYKISKQRGTVIYDGLDTKVCETSTQQARDSSVRREFGIPDDSPIIGMAARVAPQKDYPTLIKAAARLIRSEPKVRFLIVGDYSSTHNYRDHYEEVKLLLANHGVTSHFVFTDFRDDVMRLMSAMDVFTLSTHEEGLPLVVLEAMAVGKPVVATAVDGIPEIVIDGETGFLYPHEDDAKLAAHLMKLLQDKQLAANLGSAGRKRVESKFSRARFAEDMINLYCQMLRCEPVAWPEEAMGEMTHNLCVNDRAK